MSAIDAMCIFDLVSFSTVLPVSTIAAMCTVVYRCVRLCTDVYRCVPMCTDVYG